jgi:hypothetical protein
MGELTDNQTESTCTVNQCIKSEWPSINKVWKVTLILKGNYWPPKSKCGLYGRIFIGMSPNSDPKASLPLPTLGLKNGFLFMEIRFRQERKVNFGDTNPHVKSVLYLLIDMLKTCSCLRKHIKRYAIVNSASKAWTLLRCFRGLNNVLHALRNFFLFYMPIDIDFKETYFLLSLVLY